MREEEKLLYIKETMENIAHQWRQPLSQINSTVGVIDKILYEKKIQEPLLEEKLQEIEALTKYMSNVIDDFKSHFMQNVEKEEIDLAIIVKQAVSNLLVDLKENSIKITLNLEDEYKYLCYGNQLQEIIIVFLNNAKDALLERNTFEAKIDVQIFYLNSEFIIKIADNAGGITKSVREKIFEPYYTTKHKSVGTGIGLYMAKKIITERYSGTIDVENIEDGSVFSLHLPTETG